MSLVPRPAPSFNAPSALEYFDALVADDDQFPLLEAAIAIAQDETPGLDVEVRARPTSTPWRCA